MTNDVDINLVGDKELWAVLNRLPYSVQQKKLKQVLRDSAKLMVKEMRNQAPKGDTGNLKRSIGVITGRSKRSAVVFVGPRMSHNYGKRQSGNYSGWVANILEFSKNQDRVPKKKKGLITPWGVRKSVRGFKAKPFVIPSIKRTINPVKNNLTMSVRKIILKEMEKARKK